MSKDAGHFLRKVAKFVVNPTTDWAQLNEQSPDHQENEYAKAEIKAMIERKRRNDFVRKRELDMLRKIRREGRNQDGAHALTTPSNLGADTRSSGGGRSDIAVKAKIDAIEQQMVGSSDGRRTAAAQEQVLDGPTVPATQPMHLPIARPAPYPPADQRVATVHVNTLEPKPVAASSGSYASAGLSDFSNAFAVDVSEAAHDPDLDEAVIAFANAEFEQCERSLRRLIQPSGPRHAHAETWMTLFDLYRALDLSAKFDALAVSFAHQFGLSAPQWYSLPERVSRHLTVHSQSSEAVHPGSHPNELARSATDMTRPEALQGWISPPHLDADSIGRLRCEVLQLPRPWAMDWEGVESVTPEAAGLLTAQLKTWSQDTVAMTWIGIDRLLEVLDELTPAFDRNADPCIWMLRMELLRLCNRPDRFDETAIDYCVTYELSPPSWETPLCSVTLVRDTACTQTVSLSHIGDISTMFVESQLHDDTTYIQVATLELSGQLVGDISDTLGDLDKQLGTSELLTIDCAHLIRVDFIAAGDLLNWVLARSAEKRTIDLINPHRLVALFFGAMGISEHAQVKLQSV